MLKKTTILPSDDPGGARRTFDELVHDEPHVLLVVLGAGADAAELVRRADKVAGGPFDLRHVVWMLDPASHDAQIRDLQSSHLVADDPTVAAFCIDHDDRICDVIRLSELPARFIRLIEAFAKGEV